MKKTLLSLFLIIVAMTNALAQCTDFDANATGWSNFDPAPCEGGNINGIACGSSVQVTFGVWDSEAYFITGVDPGSDYVFSFCDGSPNGAVAPYDTLVWVATIAVTVYDLASQTAVPDQLIASVDSSCTITFTVPEDLDTENYGVIVIINDISDCGTNNGVENGWPTFTCGPNGDHTCTDIVCTPSGNVDPSIGEVQNCLDSTIILATDGSEDVPAGGNYAWAFLNTDGSFEGAWLLGAVFEGNLYDVTDLADGTYWAYGVAMSADDIAAGVLQADACWTPDSILVQLGGEGCAACQPSGNVDMSLGHQTSCVGQEILLATDGTEDIPATGDYAWVIADSTTLDILGVWLLGANISLDPRTLTDADGVNIPAGSYIALGVTIPDVNADPLSIPPQACWTADWLTFTLYEEGDPACENLACTAGTIPTSLIGEANAQTLCPGSNLQLNANGAFIPAGYEYGWVFVNMNDTSDVSLWPLGSSFNDDLNALLIDAGEDPIYGEYYGFGVVFNSDDINDICGDTADSLFISFYEEGAPECIVGVHNPTISQTLQIEQISPVPTNGLVSVIYNNDKQQTVTYTLHDITGKKVSSKSLIAQAGANQFSFDLSNHPSGIYLLQLSNGTDNIMGKIVKQ